MFSRKDPTSHGCEYAIYDANTTPEPLHERGRQLVLSVLFVMFQLHGPRELDGERPGVMTV